MTVEEKLKDLILKEYKSLPNFANKSGIPYQTIISILKRGINKASISNIIEMCRTLEISVDELADGRIVPVNEDRYHKALTDLEVVVANKKQDYAEFANFTIDGEPITESEYETLIESLQLGIGLIRRTRSK